MNFYCVNIVCIYHTCNKWKKILPFVHSKGKQQFEFEYKALCCVFWQANGYSTLNLDQGRACGAPVCWSKYTTALLPHITCSQGQPEGGKLLVIRQLVVLNIYVQKTKNNQVRHLGHIRVVYMMFFAESTLPGTHRRDVTFHAFWKVRTWVTAGRKGHNRLSCVCFLLLT